VLVEADPVLAQELCAEIEAACACSSQTDSGSAGSPREGADAKRQLRIISEPRQVLVINRVRESAKGTLFYLGEAVLSECKVAIDDTVGIGLVLGEVGERAYQLAVIDAAFGLEEQLPPQQLWQRRLLEAEQRLAQAETGVCEELQATRVEFFSMLTEEDRKGGRP
jgi:alpha-D-ribose 1-methylphosphonate 5-triphosphate synthase subunit PhnG